MAGICNTDLEILGGYHAFRGTPGHEFVGEVAGLNTGSRALRQKWLGQRVCGEINVSCSGYGYKPRCDLCRRGLERHCSRRSVLGIVNHDGAFAEYLTLPLENLHMVPSNVSDEQAVFVEPLAAACEILDQLNIAEFQQAAVLGDGKLAQLIARVLQSALGRQGARGAGSASRGVVLYGKHADKLALARSAGIATRKVRGDRTGPGRSRVRYRLLVEATGSPTGLALAEQLTEPRGTLVLKSTFHGAAPVETWPIVVNELTVLGSRCGPFGKAMALLSSGQVDPKPLITRTFPLSAAPAAIRFAGRRSALKVLLLNR